MVQCLDKYDDQTAIDEKYDTMRFMKHSQKHDYQYQLHSRFLTEKAHTGLTGTFSIFNLHTLKSEKENPTCEKVQLHSHFFSAFLKND